MIWSALFFDWNAPKAFLKVDFLLVISDLTELVNFEIRSS
jgi:hypothetical protein